MQSIIMKMKAKNVLPALAGAMLALQASAQHWGFSLQAPHHAFLHPYPHKKREHKKDFWCNVHHYIYVTNLFSNI